MRGAFHRGQTSVVGVRDRHEAAYAKRLEMGQRQWVLA